MLLACLGLKQWAWRDGVLLRPGLHCREQNLCASPLAFFPTSSSTISCQWLLIAVSGSELTTFIYLVWPGPEQEKGKWWHLSCHCTAWLSKDNSRDKIHGPCVHSLLFHHSGFFLLISLGDQMAEVAGSLTTRYINNNTVFQLFWMKKQDCSSIPAKHCLVGRWGVLSICQPLGNRTDIPGVPLTKPITGWA